MQVTFLTRNNISVYTADHFRQHPEAMFFRVSDADNNNLFDSLYHSSARYAILWDSAGRTWYARCVRAPFDGGRKPADGELDELNIPTCDTGNDTYTELGAEQARTVISALARMGQLLEKGVDAPATTAFRFNNFRVSQPGSDGDSQ